MPYDGFIATTYGYLKNIEWLQTVVLGNPVYDHIMAFVTFLLVWLLLSLVHRLGLRRLRRFIEKEADGPRKTLVAFLRFFHDLLGHIRPFIFPLLAFYLASLKLDLAPALNKGIQAVTMVAVTWQVIRIAAECAAYLIRHSRVLTGGQDPTAQSTSRNLVILAKTALWVGGALFLLDNFGIDVTTFVAGLGIGGIAIALAAQAVLGDTFSSFAISLDKPFEVGDFIIIDDLMGSVEHIGLKTTRIRSLGGELLVFSNSDLTKARIRNYKKMTERRIHFQLGVEYSTPHEKLKEIPGLIKESVDATETTRFDRAHFFQYGAYALIFDVVYYVLQPDYATYMDVQQEINFRIHEAFSARGIVFAFPTQTIHVQKS